MCVDYFCGLRLRYIRKIYLYMAIFSVFVINDNIVMDRRDQTQSVLVPQVAFHSCLTYSFDTENVCTSKDGQL